MFGGRGNDKALQMRNFSELSMIAFSPKKRMLKDIFKGIFVEV